MNRLNLTLAALIVALWAAAAGAGEGTSIPTLKQNLPPGHLITAEDIAWRPMDDRRLSMVVARSADDLVGRETVRSVRAGMPVAKSVVRVPPAARRGASVRINYSQPGLNLVADGRAMEDGQLGQVVKVMNVASNKIIATTVVGADQVRVGP
jgi:flagella basal body P-ring formation protein FlgA